jgi:hypothetical protein
MADSEGLPWVAASCIAENYSGTSAAFLLSDAVG